MVLYNELYCIPGKPKEVLSPAELEGRMRSESSPAAAAAGDGGDAGDQVVEGEGCLVMAEGRESGRLKWKVYLTYWKAVGTCLAPAIIFAVFLMQGSHQRISVVNIQTIALAFITYM